MNSGATPVLTMGLLVYNGEQYLAETIDSLLAQTFEDFELVISDNASTDATEEICRSYAERDPRIRYIRQAENIGAMENFNFLFSQARGRYFKWAAADDLVAPTFLARCIEVLDTRPDYVLCHTSTVTIGASGMELPNDIIRSSGVAERGGAVKRRNAYPPWQRFRDVLLGNSAVMDFWGVFRTDVLRKTGLLRPVVGYEKVLIAILSLYGRIAEIPEQLFAYRVHTKQFSSQTSASAQQVWCGSYQNSKTYPRIQYVRGYLLGIAYSELATKQRGLCLLVIVRYLFQVTKWTRIVRSSLFETDFGAGNAEILGGNTGSTEPLIRRNYKGGF